MAHQLSNIEDNIQIIFNKNNNKYSSEICKKVTQKAK